MIRCGLTADMVPVTVSPEATRERCVEHPDGPSDVGYGYDGGGFGPYRKCRQCEAVFAKKAA